MKAPLFGRQVARKITLVTPAQEAARICRSKNERADMRDWKEKKSEGVLCSKIRACTFY